MDFFGKLRVTFKGPNSLGGNNENNIAAKYRGIHPSYVGRLDINVCGTSDPGTSALLTPFCKTDKLYFDSNMEPESFKYSFDKDIDEYLFDKDSYDVFVTPNFSDEKHYYDYIKSVAEMNSKFKITEKRNEELKYYIDINLGDDDI